MRIRKRPMLPFFPISPPPQIAPDLPQQHRDERLEKKPRARAKQDDEEEDHGAEAKERRSGFDPTTHHSKDRSDGWIARQEMKKRCCMLSSTPIPEQVEAMEVKGEENEVEEKRSARDMSSKRSWGMNFGSAETGSRPSSSSQEEGARWKEGESAFHFKKRKVHNQWAKETTMGKEKKIMKTKLKRAKMPSKLEEEEEVEEDDRIVGDAISVKKKCGSNGSVVIEGSRCSRVNGRGWRCCQQTLVGYSLCEHHLGKGRLRSMNSVRSRTSPTLENNRDDGGYDDGLFSSQSRTMHEVENSAVNDEEDDEKLTSMIMSKMNKKKSGISKARSISSLLGQTHLCIDSNTSSQ